MRLKAILFVFLACAALLPIQIQAQSNATPLAPPTTSEAATSGLKLNTPDAFQGYTLFAPLSSQTVYLIDMNGNVVHKWQLDGETSLQPYLLKNGDLLAQVVPQSALQSQFEQAGGAGGGLREYDWNGNLVWSFDYATADYQQHHDIKPLPNGDILMIVWSAMPATSTRCRLPTPPNVCCSRSPNKMS